MHSFPVVSRHHLDRVPRTAIKKRPIGTFAGTFLTTDAEVRIDLDTSKRRVVFIRHPEHARLDRTLLNARRRAGATGAAVGGDGKYARALLSLRLPVTD